jgi:hypothetical protein
VKARTRDINWNELNYARHDLDDLDAPFTVQEIEAVIKEMPREKAQGPDGFIGVFYKKNAGLLLQKIWCKRSCIFTVTEPQS